MVILIDFKIYLDIEKNSEIIGRRLAARYLKINEKSGFTTVKSVVWIDQNAKWMPKMQIFLVAVTSYYKKILQTIPRFQKQTP